MTEEKGLVRLLGIARASAGEKDRLVSPLNTPPTYGLTGIEWGWQNFEQGEYQKRSARVRGVMQQMRGIQGILLHEFTARKWLNVLSALYTSFGVTDKDFENLEDALQIAESHITEMVNRGLFSTKTDKLYEVRGAPINSLEELHTRNLDQVVFDIHKYRELPDDLKDFLGGNLLLLQPKENQYRVGVSLMPRSERDVLDEKYLRFYERLVQLGIPGIFDIRGQQSFFDGYLGRFDAAALSDKSRLLFPQWSEEAPHKPSHEISLKHKSQDDAEIQRKLGEERTAQLYDPDRKVNTAATQTYHTIVGRFYGGGAIYASVIKGELEQVVGLLSEEQKDLIGIALINYAADSMQRGQFGDIAGFEEVCVLLGRSGILPEVAERLRMYVDLLPQGVITSILTKIDHDGNVIPDVYHLRVPSDEDKKVAKNPALASFYHKTPRTDSWIDDDTGRPIDVTLHQEELRGRLREYVQQYLPVPVTDDILRELKRYGEMIQLMQGRSGFLDDMSPRLAITLTLLFEGSIGRRLDGPGELRKALPYRAREAVKALPDYHIQQQPQINGN